MNKSGEKKKQGFLQSLGGRLARLFGKGDVQKPETMTTDVPSQELSPSDEAASVQESLPQKPLKQELPAQESLSHSPSKQEPSAQAASKPEPSIQALSKQEPSVQETLTHERTATKEENPQETTSHVPRHRSGHRSGRRGKGELQLADLPADEVGPTVRRFVEEHIADEQLSVETMAMHLNVSRTGLYQVVHGQFGMTPANFIQDIRLKAARELLLAGMTVREVAMRCGFADPKYFSKVFRKYYGQLPTTFIAQNTK